MREKTPTAFFRLFIATLVVTALGAAGSPALAASPQEDCVPFDARRLGIEPQGREWLLTDGRSRMMLFDTRGEAIRAAKIMKHYGMDQRCFVGRPEPSLEYFLVGGRAPRGSIAGEDCIAFNPSQLQVRREGSQWLMAERGHQMVLFPNRAEAYTALAIIKKYVFNRTCYVGRPDPPMMYFLGGEPAVDDTRTVSIKAGSLTFRPGHTRGDKEFKGHGPKITADFTVYVSADRKRLMAKIRMKAQEWDSDDGRPQSDYTTAEGEKEFVLYTVPGEGWRIFAFQRPGVIKPTQQVSESRGYIDDDEEVDSFPGKKVVRWWHFTGDVHGDDAGVRTKVRIEYPAFRIKVG